MRSSLLGFQPRSAHAQWGHSFVQAEFVGALVNRRKLYPAGLRDVLVRSYILRQTADYEPEQVSEIQASRSLRRARAFFAAVREGGELS